MRRQQEKSQISSIAKESRLERLTNREAIEFLGTLPQNHPFGVPENDEKREFLRRLYVPLRDLFSTSTTPSRANRTRVLGISRLEVLKSLAERFQDFETDPLDFWERLSKALPQYAKPGANRAKIFLEGAVQLDTNIQEQLILQRFVSVASYKLFRRAIPASGTRIMPETLKGFLIHVGICSSESEDEDIHKYGDIIKRGRRQAHFCQELKDGQTTDGDTDERDSEGDNEDYGPLFFSSIPDTIWDEKGLVGEDFDTVIRHLREMDVVGKSRQAKASQMAKVLLDFHEKFVWVNGMPQSSSGKRKKNKPGRKPARKKQRTEDLSPPYTAATSHEQDVRPVGVPILESRLSLEREREGCFQASPGPASNAAWQVSQAAAPGEGTFVLPGFTQQAQQGTGIVPGRSRIEERSRFDTLVSAACSTSTAEQFQERATRVATTDFDPLPAQTQETLLDITAFDFVVPLLDMTDLEFVVDPQSSMFSQLHSFEQEISRLPDQI